VAWRTYKNLIMPALDAGIFFFGGVEDDRVKPGQDEM
jgi:hypothetical protein